MRKSVKGKRREVELRREVMEEVEEGRDEGCWGGGLGQGRLTREREEEGASRCWSPVGAGKHLSPQGCCASPPAVPFYKDGRFKDRNASAKFLFANDV